MLPRDELVSILMSETNCIAAANIWQAAANSLAGLHIEGHWTSNQGRIIRPKLVGAVIGWDGMGVRVCALHREWFKVSGVLRRRVITAVFVWELGCDCCRFHCSCARSFGHD